MLASLCLVLLTNAPSAPPVQTAVSRPANVLLLVADDLGVDMLASYGLGSDLPATPNLDRMASEGVLFRHCWANPVCSPTRATILTGRYSFRTGVGDIVGGIGSSLGLNPAEETLPELLDAAGSGYAHAAIGKWHLCVEASAHPCDPLQSGFGHFEGLLRNPSPDYYNWTKVRGGVEFAVTNTYATTDQVDAALRWIHGAAEPWFCVVNFNAPHSPYHEPPEHLHGQDLTGLDPTVDRRPFYKAAVEAMDSEIGRLLEGLGRIGRRTTTIFVGDNGTPQEVTAAPFRPHHAKRTLFEGGVGVPLLVSGSLVGAPGTSSDALINTTDVFATVLDIAGVDPGAVLPPGRRVDGRSFLQVVVAPPEPGPGPDLGGVRLQPGSPPPASTAPFEPRPWIFAEKFVDGNGCGATAKRAIRNARYKLHRNPNAELLFDLETDPFELDNLLHGGLTATEQAAYDELSAALDLLLATPDCLP